MRIKLITLVRCSIAIWITLQSAFALELDASNPKLPLGSHLEYLIDHSHSLTIENIQSQPASSWFRLKQDAPAFGFMQEPLWARINLSNPSNRLLPVLIEIAFPPLDRIDLFQLQSGNIVHHITVGDFQEFSSRPYQHRNFLLPISLQKNNRYELYLRIQTEGALQLPITLWNPIDFFLHDQYRLIANSFIFGVLFVMASYNLLLFLRVRDSVYLYYAGYVSSFYLYQLIATGLGFQLLWPTALLWNKYSAAFILPLNILFVALFFMRVYGIRSRYPKTHHLIVLNAYLALFCIMLPLLLTYHIAITCSVALVAFSSCSALWLCYFLWFQHRSRSNMYLALAFTVFLCGAMVLALSRLGMVPRSYLTEYAASIGACIEAVLLSYALAERLHEARVAAETETRKLHDDLLKAERQHSSTLEDKVSQRTTELEAALKQVNKLNASLQELTFTDQLTGARNRRFMDVYLEREFELSERNHTPLGLIIIDIDHFKQINDTYGHAAGDECLIQICRRLYQNIRQPADELCRLGGEEFVIILPNTPVDGVMLAAEKLRSCMETLEVEIGERIIKLTASFGATCLEPDQDLAPTQLLEIADQALYQAKADGRNRVIFANSLGIA